MRPDERSRYTEANRAAWNEVMPLHQRAAREKWDRAFAQPGYSCLPDDEVELWRQVGLTGRAVAHLCCNNGVELLSLKDLGAGECVGFDISDEAIREAQERAMLAGIACQYVRGDIYALDLVYYGAFDLVYFSAGALEWLPDLLGAFTQAAALLRPGGQLFIHEIHPFAEMLARDGESDELVHLAEPYFRQEPYEDYGGLDYVGGSEHVSALPQYCFVHTMADIITAVLASGMELQRLIESPRDISAGHRRLEAANLGVPLSFFLVAGRSGERVPSGARGAAD